MQKFGILKYLANLEEYSKQYTKHHKTIINSLETAEIMSDSVKVI